MVNSMVDSSPVVIIGAGPAGLTAASELRKAGFSNVVVLESSDMVGGISRTVNHRGNRIDIGGHRFFSKSDWVMNWWAAVLPLEAGASTEGRSLQYQGKTRETWGGAGTATENSDEVMLIRNRLSRIYFNKRFFDYPLKLNLDTLRKLGLYKTVTFGFSYLAARLRPIRPETSLQDFLVNRFGEKLYRQFFKEYTEKVWGVPCKEISAEWGAQRIKSLSILSALWHAVKGALGIRRGGSAQTSLIESFVYPKYGPGQMWEVVARNFVAAGGQLIHDRTVSRVELDGDRVSAVVAVNEAGVEHRYPCATAISTMPIKDLVAALPERWSPEVRSIAGGLEYRDFITVGLLYPDASLAQPLSDNWIYIQEPGVQVGRVQVFNNWSPYMVKAPGTVWLGLEFFCKETDALWKMSDAELKALAQTEMHQIGLVHSRDAMDAVVIRVPKAYPGYFGASYARFDEVRQALDRIQNLYLVGRNGMHRYNNQDHSMLTAKMAVDLIIAGQTSKEAIWSINVDDEYHEEKK